MSNQNTTEADAVSGLKPLLSVRPYYEQDGIAIYHADCRQLLPKFSTKDFAVMITDPPYGIDYKSGSRRKKLASSIKGDKDTTLRDFVIEWWGENPALVFGSWKIERPIGTHTRLVWDTKGALGMGNLKVPWKPSDQEIYVLGYGFKGKRTNNVLRYPPVQAMASNGRLHPHQKPIELLGELIRKSPPGKIIDPFMGVGSTLLAAKKLGRTAVGIEIEEKYCEMAVDRLSQTEMRFSSK